MIVNENTNTKTILTNTFKYKSSHAMVRIFNLAQ